MVRKAVPRAGGVCAESCAHAAHVARWRSAFIHHVFNHPQLRLTTPCTGAIFHPLRWGRWPLYMYVGALELWKMAENALDTQIVSPGTARLNPIVAGDAVRLDRAECRRLGEELHDVYVGNRPYPHIAIDNFLPVEVLRRVVDEFPVREPGRFADAHSNLKTDYTMEKISSHYITNLLTALNSSQFLAFLEELTGIKGLMSDPHFAGGGLHETARGGHLSIHADFNVHRTLGVRRRINLIVFLNEHWKEEYGGHLELWERDMSACSQKILPVLGRAVLFNTESDSFHGHPDPTLSPPDVFRRSIALYYYTAERSNAERARTTDFKVRPGSKDQRAPIGLRMRELARDLTPPLIDRWLRRR